MELDEHWLHVGRKHIIHILQDLRLARTHLCEAVPHAKCLDSADEQAQAIEQNIDALRIGVDDTIVMCAEMADALKQRMKEPNAKPVQTNVGYSPQVALTPFQRRLIREGALKDIPTIPILQEPNNREARMPTIAPFTIRRKKQKKRTTDKQHPPL